MRASARCIARSSVSCVVSTTGRFEAGENTYTPAAGKDPGVFAVGLRFNPDGLNALRNRSTSGMPVIHCPFAPVRSF